MWRGGAVAQWRGGANLAEKTPRWCGVEIICRGAWHEPKKVVRAQHCSPPSLWSVDGLLPTIPVVGLLPTIPVVGLLTTIPVVGLLAGLGIRSFDFQANHLFFVQK